MADKKTGKVAAHDASELLKKSKIKKVKTVAASDLSQVSQKKSKPKSKK